MPSQKSNNRTQLNNPMVKEKHGVPVGNRFNGSRWSLSGDEDYIIFCFGEDGAYDIKKDHKGVDGMHKSPKLLNSKVCSHSHYLMKK